MHRSRFVACVIDCQTGDLDAAARFGSGALAYPEPRFRNCARLYGLG